MWQLEYSDKEYSILAGIEKGREPPKWYLDKPEMNLIHEIFIKSFNDLDTCRNYSMGVGPIPWKDIHNYANFLELDYDLINFFIQVIRAMDIAFIKWQSKKKNG